MAETAPKKKTSQNLTAQFTGAATDKARAGLAAQQDQVTTDKRTIAENEAADTVDKAANERLVSSNAALAKSQADIADPTRLMSARQKDIVEGSQFGEAVIGDGLGRLGDKQVNQDMLAQQGELAKGFSSQEELARTERGLESISGDVASRSRAMQARMAGSGVKGALAGQALGNISAAGVQARGNLQRDLQIENRNAQQEGLKNQFEAQMGVQKFDIGQDAKEKDIILQAGMGFGSLGAQERGAKLQADTARQSAAIQSQSNKDSGCVIATHAISTGAFQESDRRRAVVWCKKYLHGNPIGETFRKGYKHVGKNLIKEMERTGDTKYHKEFQSWVDFATGKDRSFKKGLIFIKRSIQMFCIGLFIK